MYHYTIRISFREWKYNEQSCDTVVSRIIDGLRSMFALFNIDATIDVEY